MCCEVGCIKLLKSNFITVILLIYKDSFITETSTTFHVITDNVGDFSFSAVTDPNPATTEPKHLHKLN